MKNVVAIMLAFSLFAGAPAISMAQTSTTGTVLMTAGDILLMRPFSFAATVVGFALFVVGYPIIAVAGNETAWNDMVVKPFDATFTRCLGCDMVADDLDDDGDASS